MVTLRLLILGTIVALLSGCMAGPMPMSAGEFRAAMDTGAGYAGRESYDVSLPYETVAGNLARLAPKCFNGTLKATAISVSGNAPNHYYHYKATVVKAASSMEVHVQSYHEGDEVFLRMPEGGLYTVVADAVKVNAKTTHVNLYYGKPNGTSMAQAIKAWSKNQSLRCPDMTR